MAPLVSIITPTYNHEKYIGECIESVLNQTFEDWEMLIIDDGSTDNTSDVVASYKDDRIRYFRQEHVGIWRLSETYNKGLRFAKGKYIAFLEGDDYWPPYKLERQVRAFDNKNVVLACGKRIEVNNEGENLGIIIPLRRRDFTKDIYQNKPIGSVIKECFLRGPFINSQTFICRKDSLMQIGGFPHLFYWELPLCLELSLIGEFYATNEILGYHRRHSAQVTQTCYKDSDIRRIYEACDQFLEDFYDRIPLEMKDRLGINKRILRQILQRNFEKIVGGTYLSIGRIELLNQNWSSARRYFIEAIKIVRLREKLLALVGLGFSFIRKDIETICKMVGSPKMR